MIFFETTPSGRIINRFTADTEMMDFTLLMTTQQWLNCVMAISGTLCIIAIINPWFLCVLPCVAAIYVMVYRYSVRCVVLPDLSLFPSLTISHHLSPSLPPPPLPSHCLR